MSYRNFVPTVWAEGIQRELARKCVALEDCHREYEGEVKKRGDSVRILGIGKPTITEHDPKKPIVLAEPETIEDASQIMYINQLLTYNYKIDDIDEAQAKEGIDAALKGETSEVLANRVDRYILSLAGKGGVPLLYTSPVKIGTNESKLTEGEKYLLDVFDEAREKLLENDVADSTKVVATFSPRINRLMAKARRGEDTDNTKILDNGVVGTYNKTTLKMSNNVYRDTAKSVEYVMVRTQRAIAAVEAISKSEAYRPEKGFSDAIKGMLLHDAKVVRPKEIVVIPIIYA